MTTHDINYACKHDFINLEHLSRFYNYIFDSHDFSVFSFEVCFVTIIKVMSR